MTGRGVQTTRVRSFDFMPNFEDAPDGTSSINHTTTPPDFQDDLDLILADGSVPLVPPPPSPPYPEGVTRWPAPTPNPVGYSSEFPPHPSYAGVPPSHVEGYHNTAIGAEQVARRPQRVTEVAEDQRRARINTEPYQCSPPPLAPPPPRRPGRRREFSDPDAAIRKDPNAWSLREAVELCKLLEVVLPEAGFHIALTGPLLYLDGKRKECHLMFYQIRGTEPNYEILWKYLTVAGVIRSTSYPENGWLVKATYRGKAIDCLFPNAKKLKKFSEVSKPLGEKPTAANQDTPPSTPPNLNTAVGSVAYPIPPIPPIPPTPPPTINSAVAASRLVESAANAFVSPPEYIDRSFAALRRMREDGEPF